MEKASQTMICFKKAAKLNFVVLFAWMFFLASCVFAGPSSNKIFMLRNIDAETAITTLKDLNIGETVNKVKNVNALIVTAQPLELKKAQAVINLMDSKKDMQLKTIAFEKDYDLMKAFALLDARFADVGFGTFTAPPIQDVPNKALLDRLKDGKTIIITTPEMMEPIEETLQRFVLKKEEKSKEQKEASRPEGMAVVDEDNLADVIRKEKAPEVEDVNDEAVASTDEFDIAQVLEKAEKEREEEIVEKRTEIAGQLPVAEEEVEDGRMVIELTKEDLEEKAQQRDQDEELLEMLKEFGKFEKTNGEREDIIDVPQAKAEPNKPVVELANPIIPDGNMVLELQLPERVNVLNLLDLLGEYMGLDYIYDETKIRGDITLKVQGPITIRDLYAYVEAILKSKGFAMVRGRGKLVMIVPVAEAISYDPQLIGKDREVRAGNVFVTNVFELSYVDTVTASKLLTEMKLGASIVQVPEAQTIIVTDYANRMQRIEDLLNLIDKPGVPKEVVFRQVEYISVTSLIPKLEKLAEELGSVGIATTIEATTPGQPERNVRVVRGRRVRNQQPSPAPESPDVPAEKMVFLEADERTNRIIMIGSADQLGIVDELIDSLDIKQKDFREIKLYEIVNVAAEEVQSKLAELEIAGDVQKTQTRRTAASPRGAAARQAPNQPGAQATTLEEETSVGELAQVVLLEATNSLLVNATPEQHEQIQMIIAYIDQIALESSTPYVVYPLENQDPKILAETLNEIVSKTIATQDEQGKVVQVPSTEEQDITIVPDSGTFSVIVYASRKNQEWIGQLVSRLDRRRPQVLINVSLVEISDTDNFEFDLNVVANLQDDVVDNIQLSPENINATNDVAELKWGNTFQGFWTADKIQVLLNTVESKGYGRVLAQPKILVNDNEEGLISTSETTHVALTTQSFPGEGTTPVESTVFEPYDAKIELAITPNIGEGDLLRLTVEMTREDFTEVPADAPPDYARSNVNTIVTVPDGSTIILGGLTKLNQGKNTTKVPLLGDLPLIGGAFRSINNLNDSTKLYVFVKANILRPDDTLGVGQLKRISERNREEFEKDEREFQKYESWPGVKPDPLDPIRVLDTE